jgi:ketosteroid isomerase-like protein
VIKASKVDSFLIAFSENSDRSDFTDYEKALLLEKIRLASGMKHKDIAATIGKSNAFVSQHIAMLNLFPENIATWEERNNLLNQLSENHGRILSKIEDPYDRWNAAKLVVRAKMGVRELQKLYSRTPRKRKSQNERSIREIIEKLIRGVNSKDLTLFFGLTSPRQFTMFSRFPPLSLMNSKTAVEHESRLWHQVERGELNLEDLEIKVSGNFAYAALQLSNTITISSERITTHTRATIVLTKKRNWEIVHEHWSSADPEEISDLLNAHKKLPLAPLASST